MGYMSSFILLFLLLVDCRFLNSWSKCPFAVIIDFGKCLFIKVTLSPDHEEK